MRPFTFRLNSQVQKLALAVGLLSFALASGCESPEEVRVTKVDQSRSSLDAEPFVAALGKESTITEATASRMIAAMIDRPEQTYFVKTMDTVERVKDIESELDALIQSLRFSKNEPIAWTVPAGWKESEGGAMFRLATITAPNGTEVTVTSLTPGQQLLPNLNRWQGQLNLPPLSEDQIEVERIKVGEQEVILYDQTGTGAKNTMVPPFASTGGSPKASPRQPKEQPAEERTSEGNVDTSIPFTLPEIGKEWQALEPTPSKVVRWKKSTDKGTVTFELLRFPDDAEFAAMIGVWSGSIGVTPPPESGLADLTEEINIGDQKANWIALPNEKMQRLETSEGTELIYVARLDVGNDAWYFKWQGEVSDAMKSEFVQFLGQISLK